MNTWLWNENSPDLKASTDSLLSEEIHNFCTSWTRGWYKGFRHVTHCSSPAKLWSNEFHAPKYISILVERLWSQKLPQQKVYPSNESNLAWFAADVTVMIIWSHIPSPETWDQNPIWSVSLIKNQVWKGGVHTHCLRRLSCWAVNVCAHSQHLSFVFGFVAISVVSQVFWPGHGGIARGSGPWAGW